MSYEETNDDSSQYNINILSSPQSPISKSDKFTQGLSLKKRPSSNYFKIP